MIHLSSAAWDRARLQIAERWREIVRRIAARDEPGVLELANVMDEFCELAVKERVATEGAGGGAREGERTRAVFGGDATGQCAFCRGFSEAGGCLGAVREVDGAVLAGDWERARRAAERYVGRVESMRFADLDLPRWRP